MRADFSISKVSKMNERLTIGEIKLKYPSEWLFLGDPEVSESQGVLAGRVLAHSKMRDEVYREAGRLKCDFGAFLYTGRLPADMDVLL